MPARNAAERRRIDPACPDTLREQIYSVILANLRGAKVLRGTTLEGAVREYCPQAYEIAAGEGFELRLDDKKNTPDALLTGDWCIEIRRRTPN
jgi:hypothetical protein